MFETYNRAASFGNVWLSRACFQGVNCPSHAGSWIALRRLRPFPRIFSFETGARSIGARIIYNSGMSILGFTVPALFGALVLSALMPLSVAKADVYKYVDKQGRIYLTDRPPHDGYKKIFSSAPKGTRRSRIGYRKTGARIDYKNKEKNRQRFSAKINAVAKRHDLPGDLIHAVVATESAYDPNAISRSGAVGLMQLMPDTAKRYGVRNRRDPASNLSGGARYLKYLLESFDNDLELALAGYNAGENAVKKYGNQIPPFEETQTYVRKVIEVYKQNSAEPANDV